jgi:N-methylhydantoinase A
LTAATLANGARVGIDVGGTFTDFVLFDPRREAFFFHKEPSTPAEPAQAVQSGLSALLKKSDLTANDVALLLHGTTIGLNAIIQRRGARVGLIVSRGFRDVLEIGRARMPSSFDFHASREAPFLPRDRVLEIGARLNPKGEATQWPDDAEIDQVANAVRALDVDAVALMLINGYADPVREGQLADMLAERLPDIAISSAARTWPEIREYERTLVASLNAYIQPLMQRYFERLQTLMADIGLRAPILVTASNGGSLALSSALARPIDTVLSGPAAGVVAATRMAREARVDRIISFDMGGTSSDIAVSVGGQAEIATRTEIGGLPLVLPVIGVSAIGAGGGSKVWADEHGVLKVGPESAGADPGPAAYGRGGTVATITDCYLTTGLLDPAAFLGGGMPLHGDLAGAALQGVADALGFSDADGAVRAADGALSVATAQMASALHKALAQRGLDPAEFALVPFGGAGPTHANLLAEDAGLNHIVVPPKPGTFCALGAATADLRRDFVRSLRVPLNDESAKWLAQALDALSDEAQAWLDGQGKDLTTSTRVLQAADMRYAGQAYELKVELATSLARPITARAAAEAFHVEHERIYGFRDTEAPVELGTVRLAIVGSMPEVSSVKLAPGDGRIEPRTRRPVFVHRGWIECSVYSRSALRAGDCISGPAIVEQDDTTVFILPNWSAKTDDNGNLHIRRDGSAPIAESTEISQ